jgi:hypothetical protein
MLLLLPLLFLHAFFVCGASRPVFLAPRTALLGSGAPSPPWRRTLQNCWTNVSCDRALIVSHGGAWNSEYPYDSFPAFERAYNLTSDCVKGDFRVSQDNIGMVTHSSPIEWWESPKCVGKKIEDMLAKDIEQCPMALTTFTFISVPTLLAWAKDKVIVMLCVKRPEDIGRAISTLIENNATDRAFLEIKVGDMLANVMKVPNWDKVCVHVLCVFVCVCVCECE